MWEEQDKYFKLYKIVDCTDKELVIERTDFKYSDIFFKGFEEVSFSDKLFSEKEIAAFYYKVCEINDYKPFYGTFPLYYYNVVYYIVYEKKFDFGTERVADKFTFSGEENLLDIRLR